MFCDRNGELPDNAKKIAYHVGFLMVFSIGWRDGLALCGAKGV